LLLFAGAILVFLDDMFHECFSKPDPDLYDPDLYDSAEF
jgi:hypothetical protein